MGWKNMETAPKDEFILVKVISDDLDPKSDLIQDIAIYDSGFWTNQFGHVVEPQGWCLMPPILANDERDDVIFSPFSAIDVDQCWVIAEVTLEWPVPFFAVTHSTRDKQELTVIGHGASIEDSAASLLKYITKTCIDEKAAAE